MPAIRLQKLIASAGICSRRHAEDLITNGFVRVNGKKVTELGSKADPEIDRIEVEGRLLQFEKKVYFLLNKPPQTITSAHDEADRPVVFDLIPDKGRLFSAGRLDYHSEGVLLLTNDGELVHRLTHPSNQILREYEVKVRDRLSDTQLSHLERGVMLEDGLAKPVAIEYLRIAEKNSWYLFILTEGRNREIRRMIDAVGGTVMRLKRVAFAGLRVDDLKPGEWRPLNPAEVYDLYTLAGLTNAEAKERTTTPPTPRTRTKNREVSPKRASKRPAGRPAERASRPPQHGKTEGKPGDRRTASQTPSRPSSRPKGLPEGRPKNETDGRPSRTKKAPAHWKKNRGKT